MPASATQMTLEEAQAALVLAQQEVVDATADLQTATEAVSAAIEARDTAQIAYNEALAAYEATKVTVPGTTSTTIQNVVQNGTFDSTAGWSNVMLSTTPYTGSVYPIIYNGKLKGSYSSGVYVQQTGTFPSPTRQVTFSMDVWNYDTNEGNRTNNPDYYRIEFRTYAADGTRLNYYNLEWSQWHNWITRSATYTLAQDAVRWDIGFRMADGGFWAGAFGPEIDNVSIMATMGTTTPTTYTYGAAETATKNSAYQSLQAAQSVLDAANLAKNVAQRRLNTANDEVIRLTELVAELTPHINAPTGLTAVINGDHVDLSWTAPVSNLSGVEVERYDISWSTDGFVNNGWGWNHTETSISIPLTILNQYGGLGHTFQFAIRADNNTLQVYSPRSTFASVQTVTPPWWQISFNEGDRVSIGAPEGYVFDTPRAWYGSPADPNCGVDVSSIVAEYISGKTSGEFFADNGAFGDPCGGVVKVLRLSTPVVTAIVIAPSPTPQPSPTPSETPVIIVPEPIPTEEPVVPTPEPTVEPTPEPTVSPSEEPTPTPSETKVPTPEPTKDVVQPTPEPEPSQTTEPEPKLELPIDVATVDPSTLSDKEVEELVVAAEAILATAEQGSPEYEQALEALAVAAEADDPELPSELAAIPGAAAVLEVFNNLGNVGADMAPAVREEAEKTVIASVIATGAAVNATVAAATSAAATATSTSSTSSSTGSSGSSSGGSSGSSSEAPESNTSRRREE